jgi:hypothetical protein
MAAGNVLATPEVLKDEGRRKQKTSKHLLGADYE